ncbi:MAG: hypothetical protein CR967_03740 [Proteobacteria bacterium]|nr:MAG: hypothetical protein CR967_03740 [Pseudomonadota bacterium]
MKLGVSSCLLGIKCRYDGGHCRDKFIIDMLGKYFEFSAFCPEKIIFSTPREAISFIQNKFFSLIHKGL